MKYIGVISQGRRLLRQLCTTAPKVVEAARPGNNLGLYQRLSALNITGGSVAQTLNQYIMEGKAIRKVELVRCVEGLRRYRRFQHALEIMEWMDMRKINYSYADFAIHLDLICKTKGVLAAENYFNGLPLQAKNKYTYGALFNCYCKEIMADKALALFEKMNELNYVSNVTFNCLISLYMRLGQPDKVPQLVHDMKQRNIPMASFTYHVWMNSCASLNDFEGLERVYEEMRKEDQELICWKTYSNLAAIYVKAEQFEKAENALKMLEKVAKPHEREAYHCLLSLYAGTSNQDEVYRVWDALKSVSPVTNMSYRVMLHTLRRLNNIEGLTKCFKEWESCCTSYDPRLANTVISSYLSHGLYEEAGLVFETAIRRSKGPFFKIRETFIFFFLKEGQIDMALDHLQAIVSECEHDGWRPSPEVLSAFLKYYEDKKGVDGVEEFRKILNTYKFDPSLIETCIATGKSTPQTHKVLKEDAGIGHELGELQLEIHSK